MLEKLNLVQEIALCLGKIKIQLLTGEEDILPESIWKTLYQSLPPSSFNNEILTPFSNMEPNCLYIINGPLELCCAVIRLPKQGGYLCAGPCLTNTFSESRVRNHLRSMSLPGNTISQIINFLQWLPLLSQTDIHRLGCLLCNHVLDLPAPTPCQYLTWNWNPTTSNESVSEQSEHASRIHKIEMHHEMSIALCEAVKCGNLSVAYGFVQNFGTIDDITHAGNPLRNAQNLCIILSTLLHHALEECHVHPYQLDKISNQISEQIENLKSLDDATRFCGDIIRKYCDLSTGNHYPHLNRLARLAVVYIKEHLSENITVKDTAKILLVNANYLSGVFRQETGMSFIDFLNKERTAQAASLLRHTNLPIQHIATAVGYNNTSYFARQFLRFYNCSPRDYR